MVDAQTTKRPSRKRNHYGSHPPPLTLFGRACLARPRRPHFCSATPSFFFCFCRRPRQQEAGGAGEGAFEGGDSSRLLRELQDVRSAVDEKMGASELTLFGGRRGRGEGRRGEGKGVSGEEARSAAAEAAARAAADGDGSEEGSDGSEEGSDEGSEEGSGEEEEEEEGSEESSGESSDDDEEDEDGSGDGMSVDGANQRSKNRKGKKIKMPREEKVVASPGGAGGGGGGGRTRRRALFDDDGDDRMGQEEEEGVRVCRHSCVSQVGEFHRPPCFPWYFCLGLFFLEPSVLRNGTEHPRSILYLNRAANSKNAARPLPHQPPSDPLIPRVCCFPSTIQEDDGDSDDDSDDDSDSDGVGASGISQAWKSGMATRAAERFLQRKSQNVNLQDLVYGRPGREGDGNQAKVRSVFFC